MAANRCDDLAPAFCAVEDNGAAKFKGEGELGLEDFAHERRNVAHLEAVETNLTDTSSGVGKELGTKLPFYFTLYTFNFTLFQGLPRVDAEEIATDKKLAHRRVAAGDVAMGVGHLRSQYAEFIRTRDGARRVGAAELRHDSLQMGLHRLRADAERGGDRVALVAFGDKLEHI